MPSFSTAPNSVQNVRYFSASPSFISLSAPSTRRTRCLRMAWIWRSCWRISRETFSERSSEATTPRTNRSAGGNSSLQSSMMNTRLT